MGLCLLLTLPLEFVPQARVYRRIRTLLVVLLPVAVVFTVWDVIGILRGHWTYNPRFVTGIQVILRVPLEELVFFLVIPICGLLTYEAVGTVLRRLHDGRGRVRRHSSVPDA